MTDSELTVSILREIRDSIRTMDSNLSSRIDVTNERIDKLDERMTARLDVTNERIDKLDERMSLVEHAVRDAGGQILMLTRYLKNKTEVEVADLRDRVTRLETKVG
jgi:predicted  nucleic acid-binding Zn-ribbon protein